MDKKLFGSDVSRRRWGNERVWDGEEDTQVCRSSLPLNSELPEMIFLCCLTP